MKIKDLPKHLRPREKLIDKGPENLKNSELLAILLRTGKEGKNILDVSKNIIDKYTLNKLFQLSYEELLYVDGFDSSKACTLKAAYELVYRAVVKNSDSLVTIGSPEDVAFLVSNIRNHKKEHFMALYLNARNQVIQQEVVSIGTVDSSIVHPREVFEPAVRFSCLQIILVHNHPSGNTYPSQGDIDTTKRLIDAGNLLGIDILDHIIITNNDYLSMKQKGFFYL